MESNLESHMYKRWNETILYYKIPVITTPKQKAFEIIVGKGENAGNQHFFPFPTMFSYLLDTKITVKVKPGKSFAFAYNLVQSTILLFNPFPNDKL